MPAKPCRFGIKIWARSCSSGYLHNFEINLGKKYTAASPLGLNHDVVVSLTKHIRSKNHFVFMDNLYSFIPLFLDLSKHSIYACGTKRGNRKYLLNEIKKPPHMNRGDHITFQDKNNPNLTATAWKDTGKTPVRFISTFSKPDVVTHCVRRIGQTLTRVRIPSIAHTYNKRYNFVDLFDLYRSKYKVGRNCKKSWKYIFSFPDRCHNCKFLHTVFSVIYSHN